MTLGEHATLGPIRIEIGQTVSATPSPLAPTLSDAAFKLLIVSELKLISTTIINIHQHLTRPPWWRRLWTKLCGIL